MPSARILVLDDDEAVLGLISDTLTRDGFLVTTAVGPDAALSRAKRVERFDLVVSDVNMPGMDGFQFRDRFIELDEHRGTPFLFTSAAEEAVEQDIAKAVGKDRLLLKPFSRADLRRFVHSALAFVKVTVVKIPSQLPDMLRDVAEIDGTGVFTVVSGERKKRVVFQDGKIVFAASNDPRDLIGQAFIRAGLISEADLLKAMAETARLPRVPGKPQLAAALSAARAVTAEQSHAVFEGKIREAVLDLFLWKSGAGEWIEGTVSDSDVPFPIRLDVGQVRKEGATRRARWAAVEALLPDATIAFAKTGAPWPFGFPKTNGERALVRMIEEGRTMAEMLLEMRQDYAVGLRLATLVKSGVLKTATASGFAAVAHEDSLSGIEESVDLESTFADLFAELGQEETGEAVPVPEKPMPATQPDASAPAFAEAMNLLRAGDLTVAHTKLAELLAVDPLNPLARKRLEEIEKSLVDAAREEGLRDDRKVTLAVPIQSLAGRSIPPRDAFVLSRLAAGQMTIGNLLHLCPFPAHEVLAIIRRHHGAGVVRWA